jgi:hypothetical protein
LTDPRFDPLELARMRDASGSSFAFFTDAGEHVDLTLHDVHVRAAPPGYEQYAAYFHGPASQALSQGTYTVTHATLGTFPLFVVPVARNGDAMHYEACVIRRA